jgi:hypothetical protein
LYSLIPGYFVSLGLSFFVPKIYTAIAFDSGGVASGPLTSGFLLPLAIGACMVLQGEAKILSDGFCIVAMVAMTPLIDCPSGNRKCAKCLLVSQVGHLQLFKVRNFAWR